jgi:hypothetical protein
MKKSLKKILGYRFTDIKHLEINLERLSYSVVNLKEHNISELDSHDFVLHGEFINNKYNIPFTIWYLIDRKGFMYITEACLD